MFFILKVIFQKKVKADQTNLDVEFKTDGDILGALYKSIDRAKSILLILGIPIVKESFEFKTRVDHVNKKNATEDVLDLGEDILPEDSLQEVEHVPSTIDLNDNQLINSPLSDLKIIRKYCGNFLENCSLDGKIN